MNNACAKCGGRMEAGVATAYGLLFAAVASKEEPRLQFVVPGSATSINPVKAFKQGLTDEPDTRVFWMEGQRCSSCGFVELFATRSAPP